MRYRGHNQKHLLADIKAEQKPPLDIGLMEQLALREARDAIFDRRRENRLQAIEDIAPRVLKLFDKGKKPSTIANELCVPDTYVRDILARDRPVESPTQIVLALAKEAGYQRTPNHPKYNNMPYSVRKISEDAELESSVVRRILEQNLSTLLSDREARIKAAFLSREKFGTINLEAIAKEADVPTVVVSEMFEKTGGVNFAKAWRSLAATYGLPIGIAARFHSYANDPAYLIDGKPNILKISKDTGVSWDITVKIIKEKYSKA